MSDSFNNLIDSLSGALWRLLELPTYTWVIALSILILLLNLLFRKKLRNTKPSRRWIANGILVFLLLALVVDKKFYFMKAELTALQDRLTELRMVETGSTGVGQYDATQLRNTFPEIQLYQRNINEVAEIIVLQKEEPNAVGYVAIIDLKYPNIKVHITPEKKEKYLTSTFAIESGAFIAINGEAGETMDLEAPLGKFIGNWVSDGNPIIMADNEFRPFIAFSKYNEASYSSEAEIDTLMDDTKYNTIWGRYDILVNGAVVLQENDKPYARTIMGIDEPGERLFLLVVDGKRPEYSVGFTYEECSQILASLGAYNVMACDQGGSSCMYVQQMGGIINRPADSDGYERPVYSHFGISW